MTQYLVIDLEPATIEFHPPVVEAQSPEEAAAVALGVDLVRSGVPRDLRARVYYKPRGKPIEMVRLFRRIDGRQDAAAQGLTDPGLSSR